MDFNANVKFRIKKVDSEQGAGAQGAPGLPQRTQVRVQISKDAHTFR